MTSFLAKPEDGAGENIGDNRPAGERDQEQADCAPPTFEVDSAEKAHEAVDCPE